MESLSPERSLFPEGSDESGSAAHATQGGPCSLAELPIICRTNIRKFMLLPVAPDVFHRIQFGGVGGKILAHDSHQKGSGGPNLFVNYAVFKQCIPFSPPCDCSYELKITFCVRGVITEPCGVPRSVGESRPCP